MHEYESRKRKDRGFSAFCYLRAYTDLSGRTKLLPVQLILVPKLFNCCCPISLQKLPQQVRLIGPCYCHIIAGTVFMMHALHLSIRHSPQCGSKGRPLYSCLSPQGSVDCLQRRWIAGWFLSRQVSACCNGTDQASVQHALLPSLDARHVPIACHTAMPLRIRQLVA